MTTGEKVAEILDRNGVSTDMRIADAFNLHEQIVVAIAAAVAEEREAVIKLIEHACYNDETYTIYDAEKLIAAIRDRSQPASQETQPPR